MEVAWEMLVNSDKILLSKSFISCHGLKIVAEEEKNPTGERNTREELRNLKSFKLFMQTQLPRTYMMT